MKINVPPEVWAHFWEEPPPDSFEFWAFRFPVRAQVGDEILFLLDKKPVAKAVIAGIEKPGASQCDTTGRFKNRWKVFWTQESFKDLRGSHGDQSDQR